MSRERPILFSGAMVRAILDGQKTQTRRVIKTYQDERCPGWLFAKVRGGLVAGIQEGELIEPYRGIVTLNPYGDKGDRLWVRETWMCDEYGRRHQSQGMVHYRADAESAGAWRPSIFMPRWASRITLEITSVRVERLQEISERDVVAEGIGQYTFARGAISDNPPDTRWKFIELWDEINSKRGYGWDSNPFVWVVSFALARPAAQEEPE